MTDTNEKPCLVSAGQGFSVLNTIDYKGRFLYSKYNPTKAINSVIENLDILPGTLILIFSPGLWYGLDELNKKLPDNCKTIAIECDENLYELSSSVNEQNIPLYKLTNSNDIETLNITLHKICENGITRRAIKIDFCAGSTFFTEKYNEILCVATNIISTFWKNRITLSKMGRLYAKNIFQNLVKLKNSIFAENLYNSIEKPILVCGAGEGLDNFNWNDIEQKYFIIAVDAAFMPLKKRNVKVDAIICLESQLAIEKMFIGNDDRTIPLFLDISSFAPLTRLFDNVIWFSTKYSDNYLLRELHNKNIINDFFMPNGSVGLTAVELALKLRKDEEIPIFVTGLDFSYSIGKTHSISSNPHIMRLSKTNRKNPVANYDACFSENALCLKSKNDKTVYSTIILESYAKSFQNNFSNIKNLFDASSTGLDLKIEAKTLSQKANSSPIKLNLKSNKFDFSKITDFYNTQKNDLETALDLLQNGEQSQFRNSLSLSTQIESLLKDKDYLYLHFPDGTSFNMSTSFLKRVRTEINYFLKQINCHADSSRLTSPL